MMIGLCECGCGGRTNVFRGRFRRFIRWHQLRSNISDCYDVEPATGCWLWNRSLDGHGYAQRMVDGRLELVHRIMYEEKHGAIPPKKHLDHLCRTPRCINPDHVEPVSNAENVRRGLVPKLTMANAREMRRVYAEGGITQTQLGERFGVAQSVVSKVILHQLWREGA